MNQPKTIILLGRSGSGKGTQAKLLAKKLQPCLYLYTGDLLRALALEPTQAGKKINESLTKGDLAPAWLAEFLWQKELVFKMQGHENVVFDGSPRRLEEAKEIDEVMSWLGRELPTPVLVDITNEEALVRLLKRARSDDTEEVIKNRLSWFESDVMPVVEYYRSQNRLLNVDGLGSVEDIAKRITTALKIDD